MAAVSMSRAATKQLNDYSAAVQSAIISTKNSLARRHPQTEEPFFEKVFACPHLQLKCEVTFDQQGQRKITIIQVVEIQSSR